jgi:hypothetical protein
VTASDELRDALLDAQAAYVLHARRIERHRVIQAAVDLVVAGVATDPVIILAGDDTVPDHEFMQDLVRALASIGVESLDIPTAGSRLAKIQARGYLDGTIPMDTAATEMYRLWDATDYDSRLQAIALVADGVLDLPEMYPESTFREACRRFLADLDLEAS